MSRRTIPDALAAHADPPTLVRQVRDAVQSRIRSGSLTPGDRLPSERALAEQLGVSRTVVRGAAADLAARGLLEAAPGGGYRVRLPSLETVTDSLAFLLRGGQKGLDYRHIHEVRRLLEVEIAALAAQNRTRADLIALERELGRMRAQAGPSDTYCDADVAFHRALAAATQNPLFVMLLDAIADILTEVRRTGSRQPEWVQSGIAHHAAILAQLAASDPAGARAAMAAHLEDAERIQQEVTEEGKRKS